MDHLSGKLDNLVFLDNMSMSDVLDPTKYQENTYADMQAPAQEPRRGKSQLYSLIIDPSRE